MNRAPPESSDAPSLHRNASTVRSIDDQYEVTTTPDSEEDDELSKSPALLQCELPNENENWWYTDGSYHLKQMTMPKSLHFSKPHHTVDPIVTFKPVTGPTHVTVSPGLAKLMRNTMEHDTSAGNSHGLKFDDLFKIDEQYRPHIDVDSLLKEKKINFKMNAVKYPRQSAYQVDVNDRDNSLSSVATDESFQLCTDKLNDNASYCNDDCEENPNFEVANKGVSGHASSGHTHGDKISTKLLLQEVDEHLIHLKNRLRLISAQSKSRGVLDGTQDSEYSGGKYMGRGTPRYDKLTLTVSNVNGSYEVEKQDFEKAVRMVTKAPPRKWKKTTPNLSMIGKNYSTHPTPDAIDLLNRRILNEIDRRDMVSINDLQQRHSMGTGEKFTMATVPRQAGGSNTAMIKRTMAPFRRAGKLRPRSLPLTIARAAIHGDTSGCRITAYGEEDVPVTSESYRANSKPFDFSMLSAEVRSGQRVSVTKVGCLPHVSVKTDPPLCRPVSSRSNEVTSSVSEQVSAKGHKRNASRELPPQVALDNPRSTNNLFVSVPNETYYELNLLKKDDQDMSVANFEAISSILAQLRADEKHLVTILRDTEGARTNYPTDAWHASKGSEFSEGLAQTNALLAMRKEAMYKIANYRKELGIIEQEQIDEYMRIVTRDQEIQQIQQDDDYDNNSHSHGHGHGLYTNATMNTAYADSAYVDLGTGEQHVKVDAGVEDLIGRILSRNVCSSTSIS